jgi:hypothetical protein
MAPQKLKTSPATSSEVEPSVLEALTENDPSMAGLAGVSRDLPKELRVEEYMLSDDVEGDIAILMFKKDGIDSTDIAPMMYQASHPVNGVYETFTFEKPGVTFLPIASYRYLVKIFPEIRTNEVLTLIGTTMGFTKLPQPTQQKIIEHCWDDGFLRSIATYVPALASLVNARFNEILGSREQLIKPEPLKQKRKPIKNYV